ncbi:UDP-glucuronosyl/UDP-glucosyltransferase protein [Dioscorea alata]|uniref:UDP-glucuronosyl/UDP-glucosyltransferase protein n=1 Tax=Dioscorea alata TaxID=55571 RepID=A0ACB7WDQ7_DIOAL|nr:UDP-glucuronosyl/UDP-glucosyltransferase protein [Dioscorea alata]
MELETEKLHIFFLPFLAPGHMIPMIDMARLFSARGVQTTIVTTTANASLITPTLHTANSITTTPINLLLLPFPSGEVKLPSGQENLLQFPTPDFPDPFLTAINLLETPFKLLLHQHHPDCIISDVFFTWSASLGVPRIAFHGSSFFTNVISGVVSRLKLHDFISGDQEPFLVPGLPHQITLTKSQLPDMLLNENHELRVQMGESVRRSFGFIGNSFYHLENDYVDRLKSFGMKLWNVGPVSLCNKDELEMTARGGSGLMSKNSVQVNGCAVWLAKQRRNSVLYVSFGSLTRFTKAQLTEIAAGLEISGHPFIWVVKDDNNVDEWMPEGFQERVLDEKKGMIIFGWAPQVLLLNQAEIGGFVTHCGWNSCLESICAGVPMITWPMFAEQSFNEKLIVDVLKVGVALGVKVCSSKEEERVLMKREEIRKAVEELMGDGEEKVRRRRRAKELKEMAKKAVEEGGTSYEDLSCLIEELVELKKKKKSDGMV